MHGHRPPDRPGRVLGQPERHRRHRQRRRHRRQARRRVGLPQRRPAGRRRRGQRLRCRSPTRRGEALQPVQSGKVNQYGALLFGAAAVGAIVLVIVNVLRTNRSCPSTPSATNNWLLSVGTFLPLVGVLVMLFIPRATRSTDQAASASSPPPATFAVGIVTLASSSTTTRPARCSSSPTTSGSRSSTPTTRSGSTASACRCTCCRCFITFVVMIYTWDNMPEAGNPKAFLILMLILQVGMAGTFIAQDLILFFVFFEVVLLPMYFMIGVWGGEQRQYASLKFFLYTMFGSALMLVAFLALFVHQTGARELRASLVPRRARRRARPHDADLDLRRACSSASPSRCRCSRSTPGCPTPTPRRRRRARSSWPRSC